MAPKRQKKKKKKKKERERDQSHYFTTFPVLSAVPSLEIPRRPFLFVIESHGYKYIQSSFVGGQVQCQPIFHHIKRRADLTQAARKAAPCSAVCNNSRIRFSQARTTGPVILPTHTPSVQAEKLCCQQEAFTKPEAGLAPWEEPEIGKEGDTRTGSVTQQSQDSLRMGRRPLWLGEWMN